MYFLSFLFILLHYSVANLNGTVDNSIVDSKKKTPVKEEDIKNPINYTSVIEKLVNQQSSRNITSEELEELYGHKVKAGLVSAFAVNLLVEGSRQIMLNEIRRHFNFKPQKLGFNELTTKEELETPNPSLNCKVLTYFQEKMLQTKRIMLLNLFYQFYEEDTDRAERFIDKKYPEHRQVYRVKSKEIRKKRALTKKNIDEVHGWFIGYTSVFHSHVGDMLGRWAEENIFRRKPESENDWHVPLNITYC